MKISKKATLLLVISFVVSSLWAQQKHALVIGNGAYMGISRLNNPVNDANDMETTLRGLGFTVTKITDANLDQMETAIMTFVRRLGASTNTYGFFFYAGHGVQANGENYLIPVDASSIQSENHLRQRAVSVQTLLANLNDAKNELNMIVLDACRDNPFSWSRSGGARGLSVPSGAPAGSIVMYATSANSVADDGNGRNGLFTGQLLSNLKTQDMSVYDVFDKTMADVIRITNGRQHPELSVRFPGATSTYLDPRPAQPAPPPAAVTPVTVPSPSPSTAAILGTIIISSEIAGDILIDGQAIGTRIREGGTVTVSNLETGMTEVAVRAGDGTITRTQVRVVQGQTVSIGIGQPADNARKYFDSGELARARSAWDAAITDYNEAIKLDPNMAVAYRARGVAYHNKNDYDRAIADYNQDIRLTPNSALSYYNRGVAYSDKRDYDNALSSFTQAITINANFTEAYFERGLAYLRKNNYDAAITDYTQTIRLDATWAEAYFNRGLAYLNKNNNDSAIADYNQAIRLNPTWAAAYQNRGVAYQRKGDTANANSDLSRARDLGYR